VVVVFNCKLINLQSCLFCPVQVMHGGLFSEDNVVLDDLRKIERNRQPPDSGEEVIMHERFWNGYILASSWVGILKTKFVHIHTYDLLLFVVD